MKNLDLKEICWSALQTWGENAQVIMMVEEAGELLTSLSQYRRGRISKSEVLTEIADVSIMVIQMAILFGWDEFVSERERKLARLKKRLESTPCN